MNSQRVWNLVRVVVAVSLVLQSAASFSAMPVSAKAVAPVEARVIAEPSSVQAAMVQPAAPNAGPFVSPVVTPTVSPEASKGTAITGTLTVSETRKTIDQAGGQLQSADKRVQLDIPVGLFKGTTRVSITSHVAERSSAQPGLLFQFELQAQDIASGAEKAVFEKPITLTVNVRDLPGFTSGQNWFIAYRDPNDPNVWHRVDTEWQDSTGVLAARITHFSSWGVGSEPGKWHYQWQPPSVSTFSGAAVFNYPIPVPVGRHELTPNVDLSYSSRGIDGLVLSNQDEGLFGLGWSMSDIEISRNGVHLWSDGQHYRLIHPDSFTLALNGGSYTLRPAPGSNTTTDSVVTYSADQAPQLFVQRIYDPSAQNTNPDKIYWIVKTGEGTTYRLGYTPDAETGQDMLPNASVAPIVSGHPGVPGITYSGIRWRVDTVTDVYGNQIQYDYAVLSNQVDDYYTNKPTDNWSRSVSGVRVLSDIRYNYAALAPNVMTRMTGSYMNRIVVDRSTTPLRIKLYQSDLATPFKTIEISKGNSFYWECGQSSGNNYVTQIREVGRDGVKTLPATTFSYTPKPHGAPGTVCFQYAYLEQVDNGYGGHTKFTYDTDNRRDTSGGCPGGGWECGFIPSFGRSYFVITTETWDDVSALSAVTNYQYVTPCYDQLDGDLGYMSGAFNCVIHDVLDANYYGHSSLVGFARTTVTTQDYGGVTLSKAVSQFHQDRDRLGRAWRTQTLDANSTVLAQTDTTYTPQTNGVITFTVVSQADETTYASGTSLMKRTTYAYDSYGNQTVQYDYGNYNVPGDERSTYSFYHNLTTGGRWFIGLKRGENVFETITPNAANSLLKTQTKWFFDDYRYDLTKETDTAQITRGLTTMVARGLWNNGQPIPPVAATKYAYDGWGNPTTVTDPNGNPTTMAYDDVYHLYPTQVTNAKSQSTQYQYYGINESDSGTGSGPIGSLKRVIDPNAAATMYTYDAFGRLKTVIRPGDSLDNPTDRYQYYDGGDKQLTTPFQTDHFRRKAAGDWCTGGGLGAWERTIYDGLGRVVEQQSPMQDWTCTSGPIALQYTLYNAQGQVAEQSVPYSVADAITAGCCSRYQAPDRSKPTTKTIYDALGRAKTVTAPDGTQTNTIYGIAWNEADPDFNYGGRDTIGVTDANGHTKRTSYDGLGRLQTVSEFADGGTEYRTHYSYNILNSLTDVFDAAQNQTHMTYNTLSQKTGMNDPDMGAWGYQYDNAGNLKIQDDAKHQRTCFYYDPLNQLIGKYYTSDSTACATSNPPNVVSYNYDEDGHGAGIGHRTSMVDPSGSTSWTYDQRGRVTQENKTIDGSLYTTGNAYDGMDRVTSITYPTGEVVNQTYNFGPQLSSIVGTYNYASGMTYNPLGQLTQMNLGNGLQSRYNYFGLDTTGTQFYGRLRQICVIAPTDPCPNDAPSTAKLNLSYWYDNVGNVSDIRDRTNENQVVHFGYDSLDRLINASTNLLGTGQYNQAFEYNAIGNLTRKDNNGYTYNPSGANSVRPHAATAAGGNSYAYDGNGNMTQMGRDGKSDLLLTYFDGNNTWHNDVALSAGASFTNTGNWLANAGQGTRYYTGDFNGDGKTDLLFAFMDGSNAWHNSVALSTGSGFAWSGDWFPGVGVGTQYYIGDFNGDGKTDLLFAYSDGSNWHNVVGLSTGSGFAWSGDWFPGVGVGTQYYIGDFNGDGKTDLLFAYSDGSNWHNVVGLSTGSAFTWAGDWFPGVGVGTRYYTGDFNGDGKTDLLFAYTDGSNWHNVVGLSTGSAFTWAGDWLLNNGQGTTYYVGDFNGDGKSDLLFAFADGSNNWHNNVYPSTGAAFTYAGDWLPGVGRGANYFIGDFNSLKFTWTAENRVDTVTDNAQTVKYVYDGDGNRVKKVQNGQTTVYLGAIYEKNVSTNVATSYYFAGSQRVAMRQGSNLYYFAADHLGSTSVTMDASGTKIGEMKYYPFGETRYAWGGTPTDRRFTGQREENGLGSLYDFNARMYSPVLGRFISADTLVPSASDPQQLNRYAYGLNNPVKYRDPSGHAVICGIASDGCGDPYAGHPSQQPYPPDVMDNILKVTLVAAGVEAAPIVAPEIAGVFAAHTTTASAVYGVGAYTAGTGAVNILQGKGLLDGWNLIDATLSAFGGGLISKLGLGVRGTMFVSTVQSALSQRLQTGRVDLMQTAVNGGLGGLSAKLVGGISALESIASPAVYGAVKSLGPISTDTTLSVVGTALSDLPRVVGQGISQVVSTLQPLVRSVFPPFGFNRYGP